MSASGAGDIMTTLIQEMSLRVTNFDITDIDKVIDALYVVKSTGWSIISDAFSGSADAVSYTHLYLKPPALSYYLIDKINCSIRHFKNAVYVKSVIDKFIQTRTSDHGLNIFNAVQKIILSGTVKFRQNIIQQ